MIMTSKNEKNQKTGIFDIHMMKDNDYNEMHKSKSIKKKKSKQSHWTGAQQPCGDIDKPPRLSTGKRLSLSAVYQRMDSKGGVLVLRPGTVWETYFWEQSISTDPASRFVPLRGKLILTYAVLFVCTGLMIQSCILGKGIEPLSVNPMLGPGIRTLRDMGALQTNLICQGEWWRILWAPFLHAGWFHISLNCLQWYQLGLIIEPDWGFWRTTFVFIVSGISGSLMSASLTTVLTRPSVGASGAIFGVMGSCIPYVLEYWHTIPHPRCIMYLFLLSIAVGLAFGFIPYIDHYAHLGGVIGGFLAGFVTICKIELGTSSPYKDIKKKKKSLNYQDSTQLSMNSVASQDIHHNDTLLESNNTLHFQKSGSSLLPADNSINLNEHHIMDDINNTTDRHAVRFLNKQQASVSHSAESRCFKDDNMNKYHPSVQKTQELVNDLENQTTGQSLLSLCDHEIDHPIKKPKKYYIGDSIHQANNDLSLINGDSHPVFPVINDELTPSYKQNEIITQAYYQMDSFMRPTPDYTNLEMHLMKDDAAISPVSRTDCLIKDIANNNTQQDHSFIDIQTDSLRDNCSAIYPLDNSVNLVMQQTNDSVVVVSAKQFSKSYHHAADRRQSHSSINDIKSLNVVHSNETHPLTSNSHYVDHTGNGLNDIKEESAETHTHHSIKTPEPERKTNKKRVNPSQQVYFRTHTPHTVCVIPTPIEPKHKHLKKKSLWDSILYFMHHPYRPRKRPRIPSRMSLRSTYMENVDDSFKWKAPKIWAVRCFTALLLVIFWLILLIRLCVLC